jgi:hypothetical protein
MGNNEKWAEYDNCHQYYSARRNLSHKKSVWFVWSVVNSSSVVRS